LGHIFTSKIVDSRHVNWGIEKGMAKYENIIKKNLIILLNEIHFRESIRVVSDIIDLLKN